jgi:hypothetical protein
VSNILTIAAAMEGTTDERFLLPVIQRTFELLAFDCEGDIDVFDPVCIKFQKEGSFTERVLAVSKEAKVFGINVLCIHTDADSGNDKNAFLYKIRPAFDAVTNRKEDDCCKNLVAVVPVHMTESWMLADKALLKTEIGTNKPNIDLGIHRAAESIADPKEVIINALSIVQRHLPKRRSRLTIDDLYQPIGQKISIEKLCELQSFVKFKEAGREALIQLNYMH